MLSLKSIALLLMTAQAIPLQDSVKSAPNDERKASGHIDRLDRLTLERTMCYGFCPAYRITVLGDGGVEYVGMHYVKLEGAASSTLSRNQIQELVAAVNKAEFFSLRDHYESADDGCPTHMTDNPSVVTTVTAGTVTKMVHHDLGCREAAGRGPDAVFPRTLTRLEKSIDAIVGTEKWTGTEEERSAAVSGGAAAPQATAQARERLLKAFASPESLGDASVLNDIVAIGPRLWTGSAPARNGFGSVSLQTHALVGRDMVARWNLSPADVATLPDSARESVVQDPKQRVPVLTGAIVRRTREVLPAMVLSQAGPSAFPFSIRGPSGTEVEFIRSVVPFELSEPLFVLESGSKAFLCNVDKNGKVIFVEML